jgi:hypothetical protein
MSSIEDTSCTLVERVRATLSKGVCTLVVDTKYRNERGIPAPTSNSDVMRERVEGSVAR